MRKLTFGGSTATNNINFGSRVETAAWVPVISDVSKGAVDAGGTLTGQGGGGFVVEIAEPTLKHDAATGLSILFHEIHMNITVSMPTMAVSGNYLTASSSYCGEVEGSGLARAISAGIVGACQMAHGAFQGTASAVFEGVFNGILSSGGLDKLLGGPLEIPLDLTNVLNPIFGQIKIKHDAINGLCRFIVRARTRTLARTLARNLCSHSHSPYPHAPLRWVVPIPGRLRRQDDRATRQRCPGLSPIHHRHGRPPGPLFHAIVLWMCRRAPEEAAGGPSRGCPLTPAGCAGFPSATTTRTGGCVSRGGRAR